MKKPWTHLIAFACLLILVSNAARSAPTFTDVPPNYWAFSFVEILVANGITNGCGPNMYCPEYPVTRAQMAVFLERGMRGSSYVPDPGVGNIFSDVPVGYWAGGWVELLYSDGITTGCGFGIYCPDDSVTREQMAVFLLRAKYGQDYQPPTPIGVFNDVELSHWSAPWIEQLAAEGITTGCGPNIYCPKDSVTRDQMAVFLVRTFGLTCNGCDIVTTANPVGIWQGTFTETGYGTADLLGILIENEAYFISFGGDTVSKGAYSMSGTKMSAFTTFYQINGEPFGTANMSGTVNTESSISGNFTTSYGSSGTISLAYDPLTDRGSSLATASGSWFASDGNLSVNSSGIISGSDLAGCNYNGSVSIIDASKNIYRMNLSISFCGSFNGTYSGFGVITDTHVGNDTFYSVISNANYLLFEELLRQ